MDLGDAMKNVPMLMLATVALTLAIPSPAAASHAGCSGQDYVMELGCRTNAAIYDAQYGPYYCDYLCPSTGCESLDYIQELGCRTLKFVNDANIVFCDFLCP